MNDNTEFMIELPSAPRRNAVSVEDMARLAAFESLVQVSTVSSERMPTVEDTLRRLEN